MEILGLKVVCRPWVRMAQVLALGLPCLAIPPESGLPGGLSVDGSFQGEVTRVWEPPWMRPKSAMGWMAWVLVLLPGISSPLQAVAQETLQPTPFAPFETFNFSSSDSTALYVAEQLGDALARANATGALPPMEDLNAMLARGNPRGRSILDTLPSNGAASDSAPSSLSLRSPLGRRIGETPPSMDTTTHDLVRSTQAALDSARFLEASNLLIGIGVAFRAEATQAALANATLANALVFAGTELISIGLANGAGGSQVQVIAATQVIQDLLNRTQSGTEPAPSPDLTRDLVLGTWQSPLNGSTGRSLVYRFSEDGFLNVTRTLDGDRLEHVQAVSNPGRVMAYAAPKRAGRTSPARGVNVTVFILDPKGGETFLDFVFFNVSRGGPRNFTELLVEPGGSGRTFVKSRKP